MGAASPRPVTPPGCSPGRSARSGRPPPAAGRRAACSRCRRWRREISSASARTSRATRPLSTSTAPNSLTTTAIFLPWTPSQQVVQGGRLAAAEEADQDPHRDRLLGACAAALAARLAAPRSRSSCRESGGARRGEPVVALPGRLSGAPGRWRPGGRGWRPGSGAGVVGDGHFLGADVGRHRQHARQDAHGRPAGCPRRRCSPGGRRQSVSSSVRWRRLDHARSPAAAVPPPVSSCCCWAEAAARV